MRSFQRVGRLVPEAAPVRVSAFLTSQGRRFTRDGHAATLLRMRGDSTVLDGAAEPRTLERQKARFGSGPRDAGLVGRKTGRSDNPSLRDEAKKRKPRLRWETAPWRQLPRTSGSDRGGLRYV